MDALVPSRDRIRETIYASIDELNQTLPADRRLDKAPGTALFGTEGKLDSMGLVTLIVSIEQRVADDLGVAITLADEKAMSQRNSPFRSVEALTDYIDQQVQELR